MREFNLMLILCFVALKGLPARAADDTASCNAPSTCISPAVCLQQHGGAGNLYNGIIFQCGGGTPGSENVCCPAIRQPPKTRQPTRRPTGATGRPPPLSIRDPGNVNLRLHTNYNKFPNDLCGSQTSDRISNGQNASLGQFPWMALLGYTDPNAPGINFYCGGTLINDRYILTAAHCVDTAEAGTELKRVRLGELDLTTNPDCGEYCADSYTEYDVERVIPHPAYNQTTLHNDIALVRLKTRVKVYNDYVKPICLPFDLLNITGGEEAKYTVAGWGKIDYADTDGSDVLQWTSVTSISIEECNALQRASQRIVTERQLCAGGGAGEDACKGDSGGPLMHTIPATLNPRVAQIGVVSFGFLNCGSNKPSVYIRVSAYLKWILDSVSS